MGQWLWEKKWALTAVLLVAGAVSAAAYLVYREYYGTLNAGDSPAGPSSAQPQPTDDPDNKPTPGLPLSRVTTQPSSTPSMQQLRAAYPIISAQPLDKGGFNAMMLPFLFVSNDGAGDPAEALAFSFLMSHSLDWSPGCYCTRHAYFIFKRDQDEMESLATAYDTKKIASRRIAWNATHAVGGTIIAGKDGYSGKLLIYDANGVAVTRDYTAPRAYFDLLGDMTVDVMTILDEPPTPEMARHLHMRRCSAESIIDLGNAAFLPERGPQEFGLYAKILKRDPNFADVRYWWANQKQWADGDRKAYYREIAKALDAYPVDALFEMLSQHAQTPPARIDAWLAQASKMAGVHNPQILHVEVKLAQTAGIKKDSDLPQRLLVAAARYPNQYWLLVETAELMWKDMQAADADMAANLYTLACQSNFVTGYVNHDDAFQGLTFVLNEYCGRADWALGLAAEQTRGMRQPADGSRYVDLLYQEAAAMMQLGRYAEAVDVLAKAHRGATSPQFIDRILRQAGVAMALSGQRGRLAEMLEKHRAGMCEDTRFLLLKYLLVLDGKKIECGSFLTARSQSWEDHCDWVHLHAQAMFMDGRSSGRNELLKILRHEPENRLSWALFDAYDRRWPRAESVTFYDALEWLHGDDPWVKQAVADFHARMPAAVGPSADDLLKSLAAYPPALAPVARPHDHMERDLAVLYDLPVGAVAAAIKSQLAQKQAAKAYELALRFRNLVCAGPWIQSTPMYARHLVYLVERAAPEVKK